VREFSFKEWTSQELRAVLELGTPFLNVELAPNVQDSIIRRSVQNVAMLQELTKQYLRSCGVRGPSKELILLKDTRKVEVAARQLEKLVESVVTRNLRTICLIGEEFFDKKALSYWIVKSFLNGKEREIVNGMSAAALYENAVKNLKSSAVPSVVVAKFDKQKMISLLKTKWLDEQMRRLKTPILIYDDTAESLVVCDSWTKFVLRGKHFDMMKKL
jgi:hypothetical protein